MDGALGADDAVKETFSAFIASARGHVTAPIIYPYLHNTAQNFSITNTADSS